MSSSMDDPRLSARGNGRQQVWTGSQYTVEEPRKWWRLDLGQVVTIVGSMCGALLVGISAWFAIKAQVTEHDRMLADLRSRTAVVEKSQGDTAIAVAKLETKLDARFDAWGAQLVDLKRAVERLADRQESAREGGQR